MQPLPNRFQQFDLSNQEEQLARSVSPYFFAYLQNKLAAYANAVVEFDLLGSSDLQAAVVEHEKLKAQVLVLEELMQEVSVPSDKQEQAVAGSEAS